MIELSDRPHLCMGFLVYICPMEKVRLGGGITNLQIQLYSLQGLTPYYINFMVKGKYEVVKVDGPLPSYMSNEKIYILTDKEYMELKNSVDMVNEITTKSLAQIDLLMNYIESSLMEKVF